ncbi:MAG: hypothetical protein ACW964_17965 [Candidatus Hodarchaeales archaeon]|jgi:hypothetical protein
MQFFKNDMRVYIDPKDERKTYQKILKDENYHPIPSKLIYSPIIKQEIEDLLSSHYFILIHIFTG